MSKVTITKKVEETIEIKTSDDKKKLNMKKYLKYIILFGFIVFIVVGLNWPGNDKRLKGIHKIEISVKDYGEIELELDADTAPITVSNFIKLINNKFYDGLTMHRIIDGFMIQGGDPSGDGTGGSNETIKGEFSSNGIKNDISHKRGVISMARSNENDSASSQFFIVHEDSPHLDGNYAAFGKVINGIEVVDKIVDSVSKYGDDNGLIPKDKQPIIEYIKVIEKGE